MTLHRTRLKSALAPAGIAAAAALLFAAAIDFGWNTPAQAQDGWRSDRDRVEPRTPPRQPDSGSDPRGDAPGRTEKDAPKAGKSAKAAPEPKPIPKSIRKPGATAVPEGAGERAKLLDELYPRLATAEDETVATRIASAIEHVWMTSGSDTVNLMVERSRRAMAEKKPELATRLLDRAAHMLPDYAEIFNKRAAVHFSRNNLASAIGDLRRVLALDPNHYKALEALGQIFKDIDRKKAALEVYRKLYEVHPHMPGVKSTMEELAREVEGQPS